MSKVLAINYFELVGKFIGRNYFIVRTGAIRALLYRSDRFSFIPW